MGLPYRLKAEARKGVVHGETLLCEMYSNVATWAPGRRFIQTSPVNYPDDAEVTPWQARLFYEYLSATPNAELYAAGLRLLEEVAISLTENVVVAFDFAYDYQYKQFIFRMGPPGVNHQNLETNISREAEVYMYLDQRDDGTFRGNFYNWKIDSHSYVYGIDKIIKRFTTQIRKLIQAPIKHAA
jgi:hypothetical protein